MDRDELKAEAEELGLEYRKNIGTEELAELVEKAKMEAIDKAAKENLEELIEDRKANAKMPKVAADKMTPGQAKAAARRAAEKKIRVIVTAMDKDKAELHGEIISCGNSLTGMLKEFVPFGKEWHVRKIIVDTLKEKKMWATRDRKTEKGIVKENIELPQYNVQILPDLTQEEINRLQKEAR